MPRGRKKSSGLDESVSADTLIGVEGSEGHDDHEGDEGGIEAGEAENEKPGEVHYPFLNMVVCKGAVLIGTDERTITVPMTEADYAETIEDSITIAEKLRELEGLKADLLAEEKRTKEHLDSVRERFRTTRDKLEEHSAQLVELQLAARDRQAKKPTKVNINITPQFEYVEQCALTGQVLERRTADQDEIERSRSVKAGSLFVVPETPEEREAVAAKQTTAKPQAQTADSPDGKEDRTNELVLVSIDRRAWEKSKRSLQKDMRHGTDEDEDWNLSWNQKAELDPTRKYAEVPRSRLQKLRVLAEGAKELDFRVEK